MANDRDPSRREIIINAPIVRVDGICGPKTIGAIRSLEEAFPPTVRDGKIDPLNIQSSKGKKLQLLNELMSFAGAMRGPVPRNAVGQDPFPQELVKALFRP